MPARYTACRVTEHRLSTILAEADISLGFAERTIEEAVPRLLLPALKRAGVADPNAAAIIEAVVHRERSASTVSPPIALPHVRHDQAPRIVASLAVNDAGVLGQPEGVKVILAFVSPAAAPADHLRFLAGAARLFRSAEVLAALAGARSADDVLALFREHGA